MRAESPACTDSSQLKLIWRGGLILALWLKLAVYNWWRVVIKSCLGLDNQPARPTKPKPTNCSHQSPSIVHLPVYNLTTKIPIAFYPLWDRLLFTSENRCFKIIHLQTCQINHNLQPLLWNGVTAFNESVHGRFSETIWSPDKWNCTNIFWRWKNTPIISRAGHTHCKQIWRAFSCLMKNVAWRLIAFHRVKYSTLLCYISFLCRYRNLDNNIDNQCKEPMNNDKDCRLGEFTRSNMKLGQTKAIKSSAKHPQG